MRELETARLRLRRLRETDAGRIFECWARDPEVTRFLTWQPHESVDVTRLILTGWLADYDKQGTFRYGLELKDEGVLIGMIDVVGERDGVPYIGYCSGKAYWNHGYMTEALKAVTEEIFRSGREVVGIEAAAENIASNRVIQKAGFTLVGARAPTAREKKPWIASINTYRLSK